MMAAMRGYSAILLAFLLFWCSSAWAYYDALAAVLVFLAGMVGYSMGRTQSSHVTTPSSGPLP